MTELTDEQVREQLNNTRAWLHDRTTRTDYVPRLSDEPNAEAFIAMAEDDLRLRAELGDVSKCKVRERTADNMVDEANALQEACDAIAELYGRSVADRDALRDQRDDAATAAEEALDQRDAVVEACVNEESNDGECAICGAFVPRHNTDPKLGIVCPLADLEAAGRVHRERRVG